jgi:hypothetical protein
MCRPTPPVAPVTKAVKAGMPRIIAPRRCAPTKREPAEAAHVIVRARTRSPGPRSAASDCLRGRLALVRHRRCPQPLVAKMIVGLGSVRCVKALVRRLDLPRLLARGRNRKRGQRRTSDCLCTCIGRRESSRVLDIREAAARTAGSASRWTASSGVGLHRLSERSRSVARVLFMFRAPG